jgi:uncharacterized HAD superfamily protein
MKLGFDIDGITANMAKMLVERMNEKFNLNHTERIFVNHAVHENEYVDDPELNEEICNDMRVGVIENPEAVIDIEVHKNAVEAIRKLAKSGHSIHHITSRPSNQKEATVEWLRKNFIPFDSVHVIGSNGIGGHKVDKGSVGRMLNLDFFLDDCVWHLENMYRYKSRWRKGLGLFTRPWNVNEAIDMAKFTRFNRWTQIIRHVGIHKR